MKFSNKFQRFEIHGARKQTRNWRNRESENEIEIGSDLKRKRGERDIEEEIMINLKCKEYEDRLEGREEAKSRA